MAQQTGHHGFTGESLRAASTSQSLDCPESTSCSHAVGTLSEWQRRSMHKTHHFQPSTCNNPHATKRFLISCAIQTPAASNTCTTPWQALSQPPSSAGAGWLAGLLEKKSSLSTCTGTLPKRQRSATVSGNGTHQHDHNNQKKTIYV